MEILFFALVKKRDSRTIRSLSSFFTVFEKDCNLCIWMTKPENDEPMTGKYRDGNSGFLADLDGACSEHDALQQHVVVCPDGAVSVDVAPRGHVFRGGRCPENDPL